MAWSRSKYVVQVGCRTRGKISRGAISGSRAIRQRGHAREAQTVFLTAIAYNVHLPSPLVIHAVSDLTYRRSHRAAVPVNVVSEDASYGLDEERLFLAIGPDSTQDSGIRTPASEGEGESEAGGCHTEEQGGALAGEAAR